MCSNSCGPKCQIFLMIISVWAILFFLPLGGLFYVQSSTLFNDLPLKVADAHEWAADNSTDRFATEVGKLYTDTAYRCWGAAALYGATLVLSAMRFCCVKNRLSA